MDAEPTNGVYLLGIEKAHDGVTVSSSEETIVVDKVTINGQHFGIASGGRVEVECTDFELNDGALDLSFDGIDGGGETPEFCEGCDMRKETSEVRMKYGGVEHLCDDCIEESWEIIAGKGVKKLKFAERPQETLELGERTGSNVATVRYADEKDIAEGDTLVLADTDGNRIGTATVEHAEVVPLNQAIDVIRGWWAEYHIQHPSTLEDVLNGYYEDPIESATRVKVIVLNPDLDGGDGE